MEYTTRYTTPEQLTIEKYRRLPVEEFISKYDLAFTRVLEHENMMNTFPIDEEDEESEWETLPLNFVEIEINFIQSLISYNRKRSAVLTKYFNHCQGTHKYGDALFHMANKELLYNMNYKHNFLANKLHHLDSSIKVEKLGSTMETLSRQEDIDYSSTAGTEKIIFLHELGILDHLRKQDPFNVSINAMAKAISTFTGLKHETIQSYLNPIYSPTENQKNNPLKREKKVEKVKQTLSILGHKGTQSTS